MAVSFVCLWPGLDRVSHKGSLQPDPPWLFNWAWGIMGLLCFPSFVLGNKQWKCCCSQLSERCIGLIKI